MSAQPRNPFESWPVEKVVRMFNLYTDQALNQTTTAQFMDRNYRAATALFGEMLRRSLDPRNIEQQKARMALDVLGTWNSQKPVPKKEQR